MTGPADEPLVTVAVPARDARPWIRAAVESVLAQTWRALEVVVVDDGSTDDTLEALAGLDDPRLRTVRQAPGGKARAMNRVLDEARGELLAVQDADDLSHPRRIELQARAMLAEPELGAVLCGHELLLGDERVAPRARALGPATCRALVERLRMPAHDPTAMLRTRVARELRFDEALQVGQGLDLLLRLGERYPMRVLGECLYTYRVSPGSQTQRSAERRERYVREVLDAARERRGLPRTGDASRAVRRRANNVAAHFLESVLDQRRAGRRAAALRTALRCSRLAPLDPHHHKALAYAVLPGPLVRRLRRDDPAAAEA